jgi:hypothetical protein
MIYYILLTEINDTILFAEKNKNMCRLPQFTQSLDRLSKDMGTFLHQNQNHETYNSYSTERFELN